MVQKVLGIVLGRKGSLGTEGGNRKEGRKGEEGKGGTPTVNFLLSSSWPKLKSTQGMSYNFPGGAQQELGFSFSLSHHCSSSLGVMRKASGGFFRSREVID